MHRHFRSVIEAGWCQWENLVLFHFLKFFRFRDGAVCWACHHREGVIISDLRNKLVVRLRIKKKKLINKEKSCQREEDSATNIEPITPESSSSFRRFGILFSRPYAVWIGSEIHTSWGCHCSHVWETYHDVGIMSSSHTFYLYLAFQTKVASQL